MFLGAYHFDGPPGDLLVAYRRLLAGFPPDSMELHLCVRRDDGLTVFDACPSADVFAAFSVSADCHGALAGAGLPLPRVEPLGDVQSAWLKQAVVP